ncbi:hypothetical protein HY419_02265 [candidate division WWE3 bacterium]|nr:hypothetical protein [candidate division WWE3 bacterium]
MFTRRSSGSSREDGDGGIGPWWFSLAAFAVVIVLVGIIGKFTFFGYYWYGVDDQEIAVETVAGTVTDVLGPGIHSNGTWFADLHNFNASQLKWCAVDPEVLSIDNQRLGFVVCGTVQRPGRNDLIDDPTSPTGLSTYYEYQNGRYWVAHKTFYLDDKALGGSYHTETVEEGKEVLYLVDEAGLMQELAQQAMKACVGEKTFDTSVKGAARDELRNCIDGNVSALAEAYGGLRVENVTVPNVILTAEVKAKMDEITAAIFDTQLARQQAEREKANAERDVAVREGQIRVEQAEAQERARQRAETARLEAEAARAQRELIEAQKANELLEAQRDVGVKQAEYEAALLAAQAQHAWEIQFAGILSLNPGYSDYLVSIAMAQAWNEVDKVVVPVGTDPVTIINPAGADAGVVVDSTNPN